MSEIAVIPQQTSIREALKNSLYPGASDHSVDMVLAYCRAAGLDPMTKPVHLVPMPIKKPGTKNEYEWRDVVMPGIELYRTKAHRTGEYAGQDDSEFGPTIEVKLGGMTVRYPEWCKVTVYRTANGLRVPYSARVYWLETYATQKRDSDAPNAMWQKRPFGQLEKCAEALALRKAFPEAVGAQPTAEEMEGKTLDINTVPRELPAPPIQKTALPAYGTDEFAAKVPQWREMLQAAPAGSADRIIAKLSLLFTLSEEQIATIRSLETQVAEVVQ